MEDVDDPDLVHFPVSENNPILLYQLIQKFAENFSTTSTEEISGKADKISHCSNGHTLILFDNFNDINVGGTESSDHMICDGCVQPILSPPDSLYGCLDCNFFLHNICAAELPREFEHKSHSKHKLIRCDQIGKPNAFFRCSFCGMKCNGMFYHCESCEIYIDLVCAAMPSEIKHDTHMHKLKYSNEPEILQCEGCGVANNYKNFRCKICNYMIDAECLRKPGRIKHIWDEHQLCLVYPPVKGHPHDFNCEQCSGDINPNRWFYHCRECDTSFHAGCLDQCNFSNIKFGAIVKDDKLHRHSLKISPRAPFKCGSCGYNNNVDGWRFRYTLPTLTCVSCKFFVCGSCAFRLLKSNMLGIEV